jgi:hypothetical protein
MIKPHGFMAQVIMQSWMFLSSYEKLRSKLQSGASIVAMLHMDNMVMRIAFGTSATVWEIGGNAAAVGKYTWFTPDDLDGDVPREFPAKNERNRTAGLDGYFTVAQSDMAAVPGSPVVYWLSEKMRNTFAVGKPISEVANLRQGLATADNNRFLRQWWEVAASHTAFACTSREEARQSGARWFPYNKGGEFRKWYGNQEHVVNWENDGKEIRSFGTESGGRARSRAQNTDTYFSPSVSWSKISSGAPAFRFYPPGFIYDVAGTSIFTMTDKDRFRILSFTNSQVALEQLAALAPTLNYEVGQVASLPLTERKSDDTPQLASSAFAEAKADWDSSETSWDFTSNPLVAQHRSDVGSELGVLARFTP